MNYVKSLISNFVTLAMIYFVTAMGNKYRLFVRQSATDMDAARFLVTLVFLVTSVAFGMYYYSAAKKRAETFSAIDQTILKKYLKKSIVVMVIGYGIILVLSVLNGILVLFGNGGYFSTTLVIVVICIYSGLFVLAYRNFQPKGIYLKGKNE